MNKVLVLAGPSGAGKSWVISKLLWLVPKVLYVDHDKTPREKLHRVVFDSAQKGPTIVDCPFHVSGLVEKLKKHKVPTTLFYIVEEPEVVKERIKKRGAYVPKRDRVEYMNQRAREQGDYWGTSEEVLQKVVEFFLN